ncbi:MAG: flagellar protein export ATPase FliI [Spirochaetes bacterium GWF1_51_8]|nr:MAG: flagellar protein export ATPase FliI [Spirochaetes bacterium GWF1_51_8]
MVELFEKYQNAVDRTVPIRTIGHVSNLVGISIESIGPFSSVGDVCVIENEQGKSVPAEVVGFKNKSTLVMPLGEVRGIAPGVKITNLGRKMEVAVGPELLGRMIGGDGEPIDGLGDIRTREKRPVDGPAPSAYHRRRISEPIATGIRAVDGLLTVGKGQRMGIFSGSGVGKSTLLGMIARNTSADINVIALIGERGREVRDFIERDLGEEGLKRSVVVVVTSNEPPLLRIRGAYVATAIAEYFRDQGKDVMFLMDSVTRFAMAQREVGLAVGEPPATKGYPPSVFSNLPRLLERTGTSDKGTITAFYSVLVEGDDVNEPISDAVRGILDGHMVLARNLAHKNHYPAIDILASISRLMTEVVDEEHQKLANKLKEALANYREAEDLVNIGAYVQGSNAKIDFALSKIEKIEAFLRQGIYEKSDYQKSFDAIKAIFEEKKSRFAGIAR